MYVLLFIHAPNSLKNISGHLQIAAFNPATHCVAQNKHLTEKGENGDAMVKDDIF